MEVESKVKLISAEKDERIIDINLLKQSKVLETIYESYSTEGIPEVPLNEISTKNLDLIIKYLEHYKDKEIKSVKKPFPDKVDEAMFKTLLNDDEFIFEYLKKLEIPEIISLIKAANTIQVITLVNFLQAKLGYEMCNCDIEKAREKMGIVCDMNEEEKAAMDEYVFE